MDKPIFIRRGRISANFTTLPNALLRDRKLSFAARGLLVFMLSQKEDYQINLVDLTNNSEKDGKHSVTTMLDELLDRHYVHRFVRREKGKFIGWNYYVHDSIVEGFTPDKKEPKSEKPKSENQTSESIEPKSEKPISENQTSEACNSNVIEPKSENPISEKPTSDLPKSENQQQINTNSNYSSKDLSLENTNNADFKKSASLQALLVEKWKEVYTELVEQKPKDKQGKQHYVACFEFSEHIKKTYNKKGETATDETILEKWESFLKSAWKTENKVYRAAFNPAALWKMYDGIISTIRDSRKSDIIKKGELTTGSQTSRFAKL